MPKLKKKSKGKSKPQDSKPKEIGEKIIGKYPLTTNYELLEMAELLGINLIVVSKSELKNIKLKSKYIYLGFKNYIINLQDKGKGPGTHWVALYIDDKQAFYYDSFGIVPPIEVMKFVNPPSEIKEGKKKDLFVNTKQIQNVYGGYCGQYSIDFLRYMNNCDQNIEAEKRFKKYLNQFNTR